jgi:hypothetical protein
MEMQVMIERLLAGQAKAEADRQADRETMKTNQHDLLKTVKGEMQATREKMEAGIHSIRSELEKTNQRTQNLRKELAETIDKTQV